MKNSKSFKDHRCGFFAYPSSILSQGITIWLTLYKKFCVSNCLGVRGSNGRIMVAIRSETMVPTLLITATFIYFMVFP
ncbi:hypothetical protein AQUCO_00800153v1 [Aquilegia coerulea]|uniref:Uncharacterized protein n=1 Tax=Aquilegia coerulea TaxID=218851 RepID=A0A2G5EI16_AQUCA|nr:hypothetical protein AQUCO_00800153v1 [Aquilegia coerulea]